MDSFAVDSIPPMGTPAKTAELHSESDDEDMGFSLFDDYVPGMYWYYMF